MLKSEPSQGGNNLFSINLAEFPTCKARRHSSFEFGDNLYPPLLRLELITDIEVCIHQHTLEIHACWLKTLSLNPDHIFTTRDYSDQSYFEVFGWSGFGIFGTSQHWTARYQS
jgi:hypothetical protein